MRSKEVEEAINFLIDTDFDPLEYEMGVNAIDTVLIYIKELENHMQRRVAYCNELEKDLFENCENYVVNKDTLRKIKANTDTYRDFTEEVLKLL